MVCMANVCRSPMALAVGKQLAAEAGLGHSLVFDAAGTHAHSAGTRPDPRGQAALTGRRYKTITTRSRRVTEKDFERFDLILAMDESNLVSLKRHCPPPHQYKLHLLLSYAPELGLRDVPDPYFGGQAGFERVLDLCEAGVRGLLKTLF